ncbi:DUF4136 domain-containing protein [Litorilituus lipolyticus]|uniref:DUF4136 domain-containing protein n=1 Tax=Litorilituus lipolyticus TaxID=2491017 RepID=A0A502KUK0_9GAMM|nr:DUF4136 domain-containing protein [Litorilituus lipolyticus]TPH15242.1 DUF4136 domain-containing protein [Litorilituus lipolyticus]
MKISMIKFNKILRIVPLSIVMILGACSANYTPITDYNANYDFNLVNSYNVIGDSHLKNPLLSDIDRLRVNNALELSLNKLGKTQVTQQEADVLVSYFILTKDKLKVNATYNSGYYGSSCYRCGYNQGINHISTREYVEGTLVIDIIDNKTKQTVYRSTLSKPLHAYDNAQEHEQEVNHVITAMMSNLPTT